MKKANLNRRSFLKDAAVAATVPYIWTSSSVRAEDVNSQLTFAAIGVGGPGSFARGGKIANNAAKLGRCVAVCEVDRDHADRFNATFDGQLNVYKDYRELLDKEQVDFVTIGTPDHWHVPIAIRAMQAGRDVYCEKPLTLTIDQGKQACQVAEETGRVFQVGTQQRSECGLRFLQAIAIAHSGRLGDTLTASIGIGSGPSGGPFDTQPAPENLDWDFWLGPAVETPYAKERAHKTFRWWLEYSGGKMSDWGAHHIDIAQWALGVDKTGPVEIEGSGEFPSYIPEDYDPQQFFAGKLTLPNGYNTATTFDINLRYANGNCLNVQPSSNGDGGNGILIEGEKGRIFVNRGRLTGKPVEELTDADWDRINQSVTELYNGKVPGDHMRNFFECMKDRTKPVSDVWTHHRTMTSCHMCNITLLLRRKLRWDPQAEAFLGDDQANALLSRPQRDKYLT